MILRLFFVTAILLIALQAGAQTDISGKYQTTGVPNGPWIFELQANGNKLTGSIRQGGAAGEAFPIYFGSIEGNSIVFKVNSPDGDRIITFNGKITRAEIGFNRQVEVRPGGVRGDTGVLGGNAVLNFSAKRMN
jgi:hypothetical protein